MKVFAIVYIVINFVTCMVISRICELRMIKLGDVE